MSKSNVVISLDAHAHAFIDLKPWMPRQWHAGFDEAMEEGIRAFKGANGYYAELVADGRLSERFRYGGEELVRIDWRTYNQTLTPQERLSKIDEDGVAAEFIIDTFGPITNDPLLGKQITAGFCRWYEEYTAIAPYRFAGGVIVSLMGGVETVLEEIEIAARHGLKGIHLPPSPQVARPDLPDWHDRMYEPIWRALDERGMIAFWHSSIGREKPMWRWTDIGAGWEAVQYIKIAEVHQTALMYLLAAGVPERFPNVHFGFIESGARWIPTALEKTQRWMAKAERPTRARMSPREQWERQGFVATTLEPAEISGRAQIGIGNLCFGSDYLHTESCYPDTRQHLADIFADVPQAERDAILRDNAVRIMGFDLDKLSQTKAAQRTLPCPGTAQAAE